MADGVASITVDMMTAAMESLAKIATRTVMKKV